MSDDAELLARLAAAVPPQVREVSDTLAKAGYESVVVGGCVRDVIMNRVPKDWDLASSAHPEEVMKLFKRTIPQGLQHGTVKVLIGKGQDREEIEVTTYRGEGAYSDARRPDEVRFGVPLREDLQRRDLTVNAIAYEPVANRLIDPFGGVADIRARTLRAVGNAVDRFTEDGLRVMRAVRFCAQLEFDLDPETQAGIPPAIPSLEKVSRERVSVELRKTLEARQPSRGLRPMIETGILASILPQLRILDLELWLSRIDRAHVDVRLAAFMAPIGEARPTLDLLKALKFSNQEAELAAALVGIVEAEPTTDDPDEPGYSLPSIRRLLARLDKAKRPHAIELWAAWPRVEIVAIARQVIDDPLDVGDLVVKGQDIMKALDIKPGPALGRILQILRERVLDDPTLNTRDTLLAEAQRCELELGPVDR